MIIEKQKDDGWEVLKRGKFNPSSPSENEWHCEFLLRNGSDLDITLKHGYGTHEHNRAGEVYFKASDEGVIIATNNRCEITVDRILVDDDRVFFLEEGMTAEILRFLRSKDHMTHSSAVYHNYTVDQFDLVRADLKMRLEEVTKVAPKIPADRRPAAAAATATPSGAN